MQIAIVGPLVAAWYGYFLKHIRGQPAVFEDVFAVFSSPDLIHMIAVHVIVTVISLVLIGADGRHRLLHDNRHRRGHGRRCPWRHTTGLPPQCSTVVALGMLPVVAAMLYVNMAFMFAPALILDRGHAFWPAMRLSQAPHRQRPAAADPSRSGCWPWLIWLAGVLALCLGIFLAAGRS